MTSMPVKIRPRFLSSGPSRAQISSSRAVSSVALGRATDVQVGAGFALRRHAVDGTGHFAIDKDDALVAVADLGPVLLHHEGLAEHGLEEFDEGAKVGVVRLDAENAGAAVAVERLQNDVTVLGAESMDVFEGARDERRRHQVEEVENPDFLRRIADVPRIIDDERLGVDALEQVRRGDVGHVERGILTEQDNVLGQEIHGPRVRQPIVVADAVEHVEGRAAGEQTIAVKAQVLRRVVENLMPAVTRFEQDCERRIPADVDPVNRVHLTCDLQRLAHVSPTRRPI